MKLNLISKFFLYFHTIKFLRKKQVFYYIRFLVLYRFYNLSGSPIEKLYRYLISPKIEITNSLFPSFKKFLLLESPERVVEFADNISKRQFLFLNVERMYRQEVIWNDKNMSKLWRYKLHYFDYAIYFANAYSYKNDKRYYLDFKTIVEDWISSNPFGQGDGWEPYPTSLRIVNWIKAYLMFEELIKEDKTFKDSFLEELYLETLFLEKNLEFHLFGNHLLKNIKVLIFSGIFFKSKNANRWLEKGLRMLQDELKEQILPDGGHFERSPMYHKVVLQDLIEIYALLKEYEQFQDINWLEEKIHSMYFFLREILHPDGEIPLFNDSTLDEGPTAEEVSSLYRKLFEERKINGENKLTTKKFRESGYFVIQDNDGFKVIIDCGRIGPDYIPGHGHCDTLSYELSIGNERVIVDSGVYEYAVGRSERRTYSRSTKAHNTVTVDGIDQCEIWGSFRVARRAYPIDAKLNKGDRLAYFKGSHDGYKKIGVIHQRKMWYWEGTKIWVVLDEIEGKELHNLESYIHFHPSVRVRISGKEAYLRRNSENLTLVPIGSSQIDLIKTPYFPEFGKEEIRYSIKLSVERAHLPFRFGYALIPNMGRILHKNQDLIYKYA